MSVTEKQKDLIHRLKRIGIPEEETLAIMLPMIDFQTEDEMIQYLLDNPKATQNDIMKKTVSIINREEQS